MNRSFFIALCLLLAPASDLFAAYVSGKVAFLTKRGQKPIPVETVVWLEALSGKNGRRPPASFQMVTRDKKLSPHVLVIPAGSTVEFPNEDQISHNLFSLTPGNAFDLGLYRKGTGKSQKFDNPGIVNVYCNVHPNMSAAVVVMPMQHYTLADADGNYTFTDVAPGGYRLAAWNEQGGTPEGTIVVKQDGTVEGELALTIDSRSFRALQHRNKLGVPYEADAARPGLTRPGKY